MTTGVLVMAHGTPRSVEEVAPFYTEIRRGRPPSAAQLAELEGRYRAIGGTSPLNELTRAQVAGIAGALEKRAPDRFTVVGGAKFADPRIEEAVGELLGAGVSRVIGLVLAPHSSVVSVGEYARRAREAIAAGGDPGRPVVFEMIDHWYEAAGFVSLLAERVSEAVASLGADAGRATVVFTAHSVPTRVVLSGDSYAEQLEQSARAVAGAAGIRDWSVGWQSAGRTDDQWLGPDINAVIRSIAGAGGAAVVVCPIGFVSDHLEVLYDVDIEARATAERSGIAFTRTASLNDDPRFCDVLAEVVLAADDDI
ncbi:MAG TPA: ferrochelatase [Acidimicrobiales bacterium]|jgi:ferrochelatase|nr:ferrochelatase [Acidimicrobiales bacterium]